MRTQDVVLLTTKKILEYLLWEGPQLTEDERRKKARRVTNAIEQNREEAAELPTIAALVNRFEADPEVERIWAPYACKDNSGNSVEDDTDDVWKEYENK